MQAADLQEAIVYCHVRGVKVHLTLNTLVLDREMQRAADLIRMAAAFGVAALLWYAAVRRYHQEKLAIAG